MYGQNSWNIILLEGTPCPECEHRKMIQTSDGGFVVIIGTNDGGSAGFPKTQHWLRKYNGTGELLWDKRYDFGVTTPGPNGWGGASAGTSLLELNNGDLVMNGTYTEGDTSMCYFFRTDIFGDSLLLTEIPCNTKLIRENNIIYGLTGDGLGNPIIFELNLVGEQIEEFFLEETDNWIYTINDGIIFTNRTNSTQNIFRSFDNSGSLINTFTFPSEDHYGDLLLPNELGGITGYSEGLIKLDANLSEIWHTAIDDLFVGGVGSIKMYGEAIAATPDGGYILAGHSEPFIDEQLVYLIKVDENGVREWGGLYSSFDIGLNFIFDVEPVSDGYVFTGGNTGTETIWLVKVDEMGVFTSTEEVEKGEGREKMLVFPNPASNILNIRWPEYITGRLQIYNSSGFLIQKNKLEKEKEFQLPLSNLSSGVYLVNMIDENTGKVTSSRFTKI